MLTVLNRGTEDHPPLPLSIFFRAGERPLRPPLDPPLIATDQTLLTLKRYKLNYYTNKNPKATNNF